MIPYLPYHTICISFGIGWDAQGEGFHICNVWQVYVHRYSTDCWKTHLGRWIVASQHVTGFVGEPMVTGGVGYLTRNQCMHTIATICKSRQRTLGQTMTNLYKCFNVLYISCSKLWKSWFLINMYRNECKSYFCMYVYQKSSLIRYSLDLLTSSALRSALTIDIFLCALNFSQQR